MTGAEQKQQSEDWTSRLLAGDSQAFAEFVERYKASVFLCCRTLGLKEDEAEDVAGETFLAAYNGLSRYRGQAQLGTWLWRIAYHKGVSFLRKKGRRAELLTELGGQFADEKSSQPGRKTEDREQAGVIWSAVRRLPKLWAVAIVLFYREEKSVKEIAKIMKKRKNTVKVYLFRGRKRLKELLAGALGEDIDVSG